MPKASIPATETDLDELREWLEELVRQCHFVRLVTAVIALVTRLRDLNTELTKRLANLQRARPRSERLGALSAQLELPWQASANNDGREGDTKQQKDPEKNKPKRRRKRSDKPPGRKPLPAKLERVPLYNPVSGAQRICPECGHAMQHLGYTNCEYLDVVPAKLVVIHRIDEAVKCPVDGVIVSAPPPPRIVEKGILGNRLIVEATADKFLEYSPVERQCTRMKRSGVDISPVTLGRAVAAHIDLLEPLAKAIHDKTRGPGLLATDATGLPVLDRDSPEGIRSGTMWAWTNALWVSFFYSPTAESSGVKDFLGEGNFARDVQADGTSTLVFVERAGGKRPGC